MWPSSTVNGSTVGDIAPTQALFGTQAARALLSAPKGSPEQAAGLLERWVAALMPAAVSQGTVRVSFDR